MLINVMDYGARRDGRGDNTEAFARALGAVAEAGGGHVVVPPGVYVTGTIELVSNLTLELEPGATLLASTDIDRYRPLPFNPSYPDQHRRGREARRHLICGEQVENVRLRGGGAIDGNLPAFVPDYDSRPAWTWFGARNQPFRPMMNFRDCRGLTIEGLRIGNASGWTCHLDQCDLVRVRGIELRNDLYAGGSDGFDVNGCRDVIFSDCRIETGDDAIVLKTFRHGRSCERIVVTNCVLRSSCAGVKIGTETHHDFRHIAVSNCVIHHSSRAVQLMSQDGGTIEDVVVSNVTADTDCGIPFARPIHVDLHRRRGDHPAADAPDQRRLGRIRRVSMRNLSLRTDARILLTAEDGAHLEGVTLDGVSMHMPWIEDPVAVPAGADSEEGGVPLAESMSDMQSSPANPRARAARAAVVAENVKDLQLRGLTVTWPDGEPVGEDYLPKVHHGKVVSDPRKEPQGGDPGVPPFGAVWTRGVSGVIDAPLARASRPDLPAIDAEDCDLKIQ